MSSCYKNGMLALEMPQAIVNELWEDANAGHELAVDLEQNLIIRPNAEPIPFSIDAFRRYCLLNGLDDIDLTLKHAAKIDAYEQTRAHLFPWLEAGQKAQKMTKPQGTDW